MGARQRLNSINLISGLSVAAIIGAAAQSWGVFVLVAIVSVGLMFHTGDIRLNPDRKRRRRRD